jgi:hypothetical protein
MKAYIKQFLTKINLNTDSGAMVALIAYGVTTQAPLAVGLYWSVEMILFGM